MTSTHVSAPSHTAAPAALADRPGFWRDHALLPLGALLLVFVAIEVLGLDRRLAGALYAWEGHTWAFQKAYWAEKLMHKGGRNLSVAAWLAVLSVWIASHFKPQLTAWRRPLGYLALAVLTSTLLVSAIKAHSHMDCPWDIVGFGGDRAYVPLYLPRPHDMPRAACFPAGHSSGGYAWMALYFCFLMVRPTWRWRGLAVGVVVGLAFGITQQLRGAHFLSHDIATITLCWAVACAWFRVFQRPGLRRDAAAAG